MYTQENIYIHRSLWWTKPGCTVSPMVDDLTTPSKFRSDLSPRRAYTKRVCTVLCICICIFSRWRWEPGWSKELECIISLLLSICMYTRNKRQKIAGKEENELRERESEVACKNDETTWALIKKITERKEVLYPEKVRQYSAYFICNYVELICKSNWKEQWIDKRRALAGFHVLPDHLAMFSSVCVCLSLFLELISSWLRRKIKNDIK